MSAFCFRWLINTRGALHKHLSTTSKPIKLPHRGLIELKGPDGCGFLQGLVTADLVSPTRVVQYGMFLNTQGRVLYDVIFYHMGNERVWLECNTDAVQDLIKHMKRYVLRSKVTIKEITDINVCSVASKDGDKSPDEIIRAPDPRSSLLGDRMLTSVDSAMINDKDIDEYHSNRILVGIPEGTEELPPGQCLPFEVNLDLMKGVSFTKGCYIGQELTSRTYHTGVLRKRTIPLKLNHSSVSSVFWGSKVTSYSTGKVIGKTIAYRANSDGQPLLLAILRLPDLDISECVGVNVTDDTVASATCIKPSWWTD